MKCEEMFRSGVGWISILYTISTLQLICIDFGLGGSSPKPLVPLHLHRVLIGAYEVVKGFTPTLPVAQTTCFFLFTSWISFQ